MTGERNGAKDRRLMQHRAAPPFGMFGFRRASFHRGLPRRTGLLVHVDVAVDLGISAEVPRRCERPNRRQPVAVPNLCQPIGTKNDVRMPGAA
jgi:hypothetical protein